MLYELWEIHQGHKTLKMRDHLPLVKRRMKLLKQSHRGDHGWNWEVVHVNNNEKYLDINRDRSH